MPALDARFLSRVRWTTLGLIGLLEFWLVASSDLSIPVGFALGGLVGIGLLALQEWTVDRAVRRWKEGRPPRLALFLVLVKYPLVALAIGLMLGRGMAHPAAFVSGFILVLVVIVLKAAGLLWAHAAREASVSSEGR